MSSFYSDPAVGGNGNTYTDDNNATTGMGNGGFWTRLIPMLASVIGIASYSAGRATAAATSATNAATSATAAQDAANSAAALLDSFDDRYLGQKTSDPTLDNDGNPLLTGAIYWRTTDTRFRVYNGSAWEDGFLPQSGYATLTGAETLTNKTLQSSTTLFADNTDSTKKARFNLSALATAVTRVFSLPNYDGTLATLDGTETFTNKTLTNPALTNPTVTNMTETVKASANTGTAATVDLANGTIQRWTLTGNVTWTFPSPSAGKQFTLVTTQDGTGSRTQTFPASVIWEGGTAPTLTSTASRTDVLSFIAVEGTKWMGFKGGLNFNL